MSVTKSQRELAEAAIRYTKAWRRAGGKLESINVSGEQGIRLRELHECRNAFAKATDEEWAGEVAHLLELLRLWVDLAFECVCTGASSPVDRTCEVCVMRQIHDRCECSVCALSRETSEALEKDMEGNPRE